RHVHTPAANFSRTSKHSPTLNLRKLSRFSRQDRGALQVTERISTAGRSDEEDPGGKGGTGSRSPTEGSRGQGGRGSQDCGASPERGADGKESGRPRTPNSRPGQGRTG